MTEEKTEYRLIRIRRRAGSVWQHPAHGVPDWRDMSRTDLDHAIHDSPESLYARAMEIAREEGRRAYHPGETLVRLGEHARDNNRPAPLFQAWFDGWVESWRSAGEPDSEIDDIVSVFMKD